MFELINIFISLLIYFICIWHH